MAVVVTAENPKLTVEVYEAMLSALRPVMEAAPGFVAHAAWATPDGWRVVELWRTQQDANRFFADHVHPLLPADARPKRSVHELHALVGGA